jgi:hypothetical protein
MNERAAASGTVGPTGRGGAPRPRRRRFGITVEGACRRISDWHPTHVYQSHSEIVPHEWTIDKVRRLAAGLARQHPRCARTPASRKPARAAQAETASGPLGWTGRARGTWRRPGGMVRPQAGAAAVESARVGTRRCASCGVVVSRVCGFFGQIVMHGKARGRVQREVSSQSHCRGPRGGREGRATPRTGAFGHAFA